MSKTPEQTRLIAENSLTDPELLRELASSSDRSTREAVASNPNTPTNVLLQLGAEFPSQLLDNPIFSLLLLENPNLVAEIPLPTLRSILREKSVPFYFLEQAADKADLEVQLALVSHIQTPEKVLARLTSSQHPEIKEAAHLHVNLAGELTEGYQQKFTESIEKIIRSTNYIDRVSLITLAQLCPIPATIVDYWLKKGNYKDLDFCRDLVGCPAALPSILEQLANHDDARVRLGVAENRNTPVDILRRLASDLDEVLYKGSVRSGIAANPNTPIDILENLAKDEDVTVRRKLAQNPQTPLKIIELLASDQEVAKIATKIIKQNTGEYDREALRNPTTPSSVLEKVALQNPQLVAEHPNTPPALLWKFSQSNNWQVRRAVAENPNTPENILEKLAFDQYYQIREKVARHPNTPINILEKLAFDDSFEVRWQVAINPKTPLYILFKELARDPKVNASIAYRISDKQYECLEAENIRDLLAEESTSPLENILQRLIKDGGIPACRFIARRWDTSVDLLSQLAQNSEFKVRQAVVQNDNTPAKSLEQLASSKEPEILQAVAKHQNTPVSTLEKLAKEQNYYVQIILAERTDIPTHIIEDLAGDKVPEIRQKAMKNPLLSIESVERILCQEYATDYLKLNPDFLFHHPDSLTRIISHYGRAKCKIVSFVALCQSQIAPELLREKSRSISWLERFSVAQNPSTPIEILKQLAEDSNQLVRAAAKDLLSNIS